MSSISLIPSGTCVDTSVLFKIIICCVLFLHQIYALYTTNVMGGAQDEKSF